MQKVMFNDEYQLTKAVLEGRKTMTRRVILGDADAILGKSLSKYPCGALIVPLESIPNGLSVSEFADQWAASHGEVKMIAVKDSEKIEYASPYEPLLKTTRFKAGEVVAVAQSYSSILEELETPENYSCMEEWDNDSFRRAHYAGLAGTAGFTNKMFVEAAAMPHQIKITSVDVQRLWDISDQDCIREGVIPEGGLYRIPGDDELYPTPKYAFRKLFSKVAKGGEALYKSNPLVFVYAFKLYK